MRIATTQKLLKTDFTKAITITATDNSGRWDEAMVSLDEEGAQARKLRSNLAELPMLYTLDVEEGAMALNAVEADKNTIIPVGIKSDVAKEMTISANAEGLPVEFQPVLVDKVTGQEYTLPVQGLKVNHVEMQGERFELRMSSSAVSGIETTPAATGVAIAWMRGEELAIAFSGQQAERAQVKLYDAMGRVQLTTAINAEGVQTLNVSSLAAGYYLLNIQMDGQLFTEKIIVK